jgi:hypothetical protein
LRWFGRLSSDKRRQVGGFFADRIETCYLIRFGLADYLTEDALEHGLVLPVILFNRDRCPAEINELHRVS